MSKFFKLFVLFFLLSCATNNEVFWCGDHACANNKEKKIFFKANMIVEVKEINNKSNEKKSKVNEIIAQVKLNEKDTPFTVQQKKLTWKQKRKKKKKKKQLPPLQISILNIL